MNDEGLTGWVLRIPRAFKRLIVLGVDAVLCLASVWLAFYLRIGEWPDAPFDPQGPTIAAIGLALPLFIRFGLYRAIFRHAGWSAMSTIAIAIGIYAIPFCALFTFWGLPGVPRTIGIIQPLLLLLLIGSSRAFAHWWLGGRYRVMRDSAERPRVVIFGAGSAGRQLASALRVGGEMHLIAFVDDDPSLRGMRMDGIIIVGRDDLTQLIADRAITDVLLADPTATRARRLSLVALLQDLGVHIRTLPALTDIASGRLSVNDLRELDIEDLLGRPAVPPDPALMARNIHARTVMVTGAGGSIGQELCRQIMAVGPATLLLYDMSEFALYAIERELSARADAASVRLIPLLGSVTDRLRLDQVMGAWRPDTIFHAAAYKHVPLVEQNVVDGVRNNVFGTLNLALSAEAAGVASVVLISTDKAVRPTNIMGATKRMAELLLQALGERPDSSTVFSMVRFGNVLGSSGSVVPLFRAQIATGGPITITHADITRYFMLIPEAAQLVIQAGAMADRGDVFVLDMGDPVRIVDLARNMIELSGLSVRDDANPDGDIAIETVGLRHGEKLFEELLIGDNVVASPHPRIMRAREAFIPWDQLSAVVNRIAALIAAGDADAVRAALIETVTDFTPNAGLVDLVEVEHRNAPDRIAGSSKAKAVG